ncbi:MAG: helix-turn-helix domain-containing protein [Candidatus Dormibacteraeota bacterium]|nr:helix-turn-helix domain-containing protein [Candidatus Dormibacteraeota bacterium]
MDYAHSESPEAVRQAMGNAIRHRREDLGQTLAEVAEAAAMSPAYVSEIERGLKDVSTDKLVAIARALEFSVADLYLDLARRLGSQEALRQRGSWPDDPRAQLRAATATLRPNALRSVADFSLYLVATQANPTKRRIGFTIDR